MPNIYDNIQNQFAEGLINTLELSHRSDFCVGYFNLRGWKQVVKYIDKWSGGENNCCRLLKLTKSLSNITISQKKS